MVRRGYVPVQLARCHYLMAVLLTNSGEWDDAIVHARTAVSIAADDQLVWMQSQCHAALGTLFAYRGEWDDAENQIDQATSWPPVPTTSRPWPPPGSPPPPWPGPGTSPRR